MSKEATKFQKKAMGMMYRGTEIFKPVNTGRIDEHVSAVREWIANIFFYTKNGTTIMIDAGYSYDRLKEKMSWLGIDPSDIRHILITHQDTDHVGAVERDSGGIFKDAVLYLSEEENRYMTGEVRRKVCFGWYPLPMVHTDNRKVLLKHGQILDIDGIRIECLLVPGHTWGHMVYLIDNEYLFTGDTIWFGADGGYSFIRGLAENNNTAVHSLERLEKTLRARKVFPKVITGHTGWSQDPDFVFAHRDRVISPFMKKPHDPTAPYDGYDESDDTKEKAETVLIPEKKFIQDDAQFRNKARQLLKSKEHIRDTIRKYFSLETAENIWNRTEDILTEILEKYKDIPEGHRFHAENFIFPAAAAGIALKEVTDPENTYRIINEAAAVNCEKMHRSLEKMMKVPGMADVFVKAWDPVSRKMFGKDAGFENRFYEKKKGEYRMDILACPYQKYLKELGCGELGTIFCENDERTYGNLPHICFERTQTLASGGDCCDFCVRTVK